jgi:hypothetical protein
VSIRDLDVADLRDAIAHRSSRIGKEMYVAVDMPASPREYRHEPSQPEYAVKVRRQVSRGDSADVRSRGDVVAA